MLLILLIEARLDRNTGRFGSLVDVDDELLLIISSSSSETAELAIEFIHSRTSSLAPQPPSIIWVEKIVRIIKIDYMIE